jgi:hypothetical protein
MDLTFEKDFLKTMIIDFKKLLVFQDQGFFGSLHFQQTLKSDVKGGEIITLSHVGLMMYYYFAVYNEKCPTVAITSEQQRKINEIWMAMEMPEKVVPV